MKELKSAILNARYIDLMDLAAVVGEAARDAPATEAQVAGPREQVIAAALFRWAAEDIEGGAR